MIKTILKGAVIGIANVIPGVSGGTMAVSMGIYDKLIHAVTHLFSEFKNSMKTLIPLMIGVAIAIVGVARLIEYMFGAVPFQTNLLFIGLILGGLPAMGKKVKGNSLKLSHILAFLLFFVLVVVFALMDSGGENTADLSLNAVNVVKIFGVGIIASATMVIPGVSGSMILMIMGYYTPVLSLVNKFVDDLISFNVQALLLDCGILVPFGIGVVLGIFVIAKIIEIVFEKWPMLAYWAIIGLIVASPVGIILMNHFGNLNVITVITGVAALAVGVFAAMKLGEE